MKVEVIKDKLQEGVYKVDRIANKNATLSIIGCVVLIAKNNTVIIKATNLDVGVEITIPAKTNKEGVVAVTANTLLSVLANVKSNKLSIEEDGGFLKITSDTASIKLKTTPTDEFPLIPHQENSENHIFLSRDVVSGIKSVIFSASVSNIKPELGSVYIHHKDGNLIFAATDSFRLAEKKIPVKTAEVVPQILLPLKNATEFIRVFDDADEKISVAISKNQISASTPTTYFTSRVVDGIFPDYEQIIPKDQPTSIVLLKQDLSDALKTTTTIVDKYNQIILSSAAKKQQLTIKTKNNDVGEGEVTINAKVTGDDITASFNQKYINDAISSVPNDSVVLKFAGPHKPLLMEGVGNKNFRYLVMPMNR